MDTGHRIIKYQACRYSRSPNANKPFLLVKMPVTTFTKNGYTHNKIAEKVAKPSQLSEYRSESSILNPRQVEYIRFLKAFQEFSLTNSKKEK